MSGNSNKNIIKVSQDIEIYPDEKVDLFSFGNRIAYKAINKAQDMNKIAYLSSYADIPRINSIKEYSNIQDPCLMNLEYATLVQAVDGTQYFAFIYEDYKTKKIIDDYNKEYDFELKKDKIIKPIISKGVGLLEKFEENILSHGNINLNNMYFSDDKLIFGDCLSSSASSQNPILFETASRAMSHPMGRGDGSIEDDLYSFGVCVALLFRGYNPLAGKSDDEIIHEKLTKGTYATLIGKERVSGKVPEFLRGVLNDNKEQRWNIEDALCWLNNKQISSKKSSITIKSSRPYEYNNKKINYLNILGYEFSKNMKQASVEIKSDSFQSWIDRGFRDDKIIIRIKKAYDESIDFKTNMIKTEILCANTLMAMDRSAPIRYKEVMSFPHGLGNLLAHFIINDKNINGFADILKNNLFDFWLNIKDEVNNDVTILTRGIDRARGEFFRNGFGSGPEKSLYMLSKDCACISPLLKNKFVTNSGDLMIALEELASKGQLSDRILDRHMKSFLTVRENHSIKKYIRLLASSDDGNYYLGITQLIANIQANSKIGKLPKLQNFMVGLLNPVINKIHNVQLQNQISNNLKKLNKTGNFKDLVAIIDNSSMVREDENGFTNAKNIYFVLENNKRILEKKLENKKNIGRATGKQISMLFSFLISSFLIIGYFIFNFLVKES